MKENTKLNIEDMGQEGRSCFAMPEDEIHFHKGIAIIDKYADWANGFTFVRFRFFVRHSFSRLLYAMLSELANLYGCEFSEKPKRYWNRIFRQLDSFTNTSYNYYATTYAIGMVIKKHLDKVQSLAAFVPQDYQSNYREFFNSGVLLNQER